MPKLGAQKSKEKRLKEQTKIQIKEETSQVQSGMLLGTPQVMEISSSASELLRSQPQPESNAVSVKSTPMVIQDSTMQSQSNMSEFLKA